MGGQKITISIRDISPCKDCAEKFLGCHSRCPKDERGEKGYKAYKAEIERVNAARVAYNKQNVR